MFITAFKEALPSGWCHPLTAEFLEESLPGLGAQVSVALYFVYGSSGGIVAAERGRAQSPVAVLDASPLPPPSPLTLPPPAPSIVPPADGNPATAVVPVTTPVRCHMRLWALPCRSRRAIREKFKSTAAKPLLAWLLNPKPRAGQSQTRIVWYGETRTMLTEYR